MTDHRHTHRHAHTHSHNDEMHPPHSDTPGGAHRGRDGRSTDIASGQGTPPWLSSNLRHCSRCGGRLVFGEVPGEDRERLACEDCGHIAYVNPRMVATAIPVTDDGKVILIRRGIEPGLGSWAQPGGFLEVDETVAEGARREVMEETGLEVEVGEIIGLYSRLEAAVVVVAFEARITGGMATVTPEALEIAEFDPRDLPWSEIAFSTTVHALRDWVARRHPEILLGDAGLDR